MKSPNDDVLKKIEELKKSIIILGMARLRSSNIEKQKKLKELQKKLNNDEKVQDSNMGRSQRIY